MRLRQHRLQAMRQRTLSGQLSPTAELAQENIDFGPARLNRAFQAGQETGRLSAGSGVRLPTPPAARKVMEPLQRRPKRFLLIVSADPGQFIQGKPDQRRP